jgi:LPXTG-site transpeptidase (sortase) family protein
MNALFDRIWEKKFVFLSTFFVVFTLSYIVLLAIDFVPEKPDSDTVDADASLRGKNEVNMITSSTETEPETELNGEEVTVSEMSEPGAAAGMSTQAVLPLSISIAKLDRTITVLNPLSRSIADLDEALLGGVVRHPDSATLEQEGTVFILGHSSYLPQVFNKNFQAFNGIQNLEWGDLIEVTSDNVVYEYRVEKVYRARAQDLTVPIAGTGKTLTLATCNSFGSADDRYIVEAKQVGTHKL